MNKECPKAFRTEPVWCQIGHYEVEVLPKPLLSCSELLLSKREWQALSLFSLGMSAPEVAAKMHVTSCTVETYKRRVFQKLGVRSVAAAASLAMALLTGANVRKLSLKERIDVYA